MVDFNAIVEEIAELVAQKVVSKIRAEQIRNDWPKPDFKTEFNTPGLTHLRETEKVYEGLAAGVVDVPKKETLIDFPEQKESITGKVTESSYKDKRVAELSKINIRTLRNLISQAEDEPKEKYESYDKDALVQYIFNFETLIGRTIEAKIAQSAKDDTEPESDDEPEDDTESDILTREQAEKLKLSDLKNYALRQGATQEDLRGLDIEAVLDTVFGPVNPVVEPEASEEVLEITIEDIKGMNLGELKSLADDLNEMGAEITYNRATTLGELRDLILECVEEEEEETDDSIQG